MAEYKIEGRQGKIRTLVFLDLEVRGPPNNPVICPRVVEMAMIAVAREDFLSMKEMAHENNPKYNKGDPLPLPRIRPINTMLYNPPKNIYPYVKDITGHSNTLSSLKSFDKDSVTSIKLFLDLPSPVCLVAHCGDTFDFPYLKAEIFRVHNELPEDILCVDSKEFFKDFEMQDIKEAEEIAKDFLAECDDFDPPDNLLVIEQGLKTQSLSDQVISSCSSDFLPHKNTDVQTPEKLKINDAKQAPPCRPSEYELNTTEKSTPLLKRGFPEENLYDTPSKAKKANFHDLKKKPFRQRHIFYRIYRQKYLEHRAEADAEALLQICAFHGDDFVSWADTNCNPFNSI